MSVRDDRFRIEGRLLDMLLDYELQVYRYEPKRRVTRVARRTIDVHDLRNVYSDDELVRIVRGRIRSAVRELVGEWELRPFRIGRGPRRLQERAT